MSDRFRRMASRSAPGSPAYSWRYDDLSLSLVVGAQVPASGRASALLRGRRLILVGLVVSGVRAPPLALSRHLPNVECIVMDV